MLPADEGSSLDDQPFAYRAGKNGVVFVSWRGKPATTLRGDEAQRFLARIAGLTAPEAQLVMAKITGNFKRGNECRAAQKDRSS